MMIDLLREQAHEYHDGMRGWDGMAIELEYAEMLYTLVRAERPEVVIETGTGRGIASAFIATALLRNGIGRLWTFEDDPAYVERAKRVLDGLPVIVAPRAWGSDGQSEGIDTADFVFLDSGPRTRLLEIRSWLSWGAGRRNPLVVIHDANRAEPAGDYPLHLGTGVHLTRGDGLWIGRANPPSGG